jgi:4-amino-4-deoxy-L-arabinose transferase-like glycosyltransferase
MKPIQAPTTRLVLCGILFLYLAQGAIGLHLRWVEDETWYLLPVENLLREGRMRIPTFNTSERHVWNAPPLLILIEAASWLVHDMTIVQARLVPLACGFGAVLLTFLLGRRLVDDRVGLVAAFLVASDNLIFLTSRTVRPDIMVTFFTLLALWLLLKSIQEKQLAWTIAAGVAVGAAMSTHPNGAVAAICGVLMLLTFEGWQTLRQPRLYLLTLASTLAFLPYVLWAVWSDAANNFAGFRADIATQRGRESSFLLRMGRSVVREVRERFRDFIQFPFRVHVGVLTLGALVAGALSRNRVSRFLVGCVVAYLLFFIVVTNYSKNVRYLNAAMPFVALLWAQGIVALWSRSSTAAVAGAAGRSPAFSRCAAVALLVLTGVSQIAGNFYYHWKFRNADVAAVCRQIDTLVPEGSTVYGAMVFWAGLHQGHYYVPYQRMPWRQAIEEFQPTILILDDRIMVAGSYPGEFDELREELHDYVDRHGTLLGQVPNDFYGDLKIYAVTPP